MTHWLDFRFQKKVGTELGVLRFWLFDLCSRAMIQLSRLQQDCEEHGDSHITATRQEVEVREVSITSQGTCFLKT